MVAYDIQADFADRNVVEVHLAAAGLVKPEQDLNQGGLAAAAGPHQRDLLAGRNGERDVIQHGRSVAVGEADVVEADTGGALSAEGISPVRVARLQVDIHHFIDTAQCSPRGVVAVLYGQDFLHRAHHEPQVGEDGEHLPDAQIRVEHHKHGQRAKDVEAEEEDQERQAVGRIRTPRESSGVTPDIAGRRNDSADVVLFPVAGTDLLYGVQCFGEALLEQLECAVLALFQLLDPAPEHHGGVDHQWVAKQDEQGQLPVHPQQHPRSAQDTEDRHQELAGGDTDEVVDGGKVGDQVRRDRAGTQGLVLGHGDA